MLSIPNIHTLFENDFYCTNCDHLAVKRYNPFKSDLENDEIDENDAILNFTKILLSCKSYKVDEINNSCTELLKEHMSIIFQNIDGVKSNFDDLATSLKRFSH